MVGSILIIEDNPESGHWLQSLAAEAFPGSRIRLCTDCRSVNNYLLSNSPELALIDINLPDGSGLSLIRPVLDISPSAHVVMITILDDHEHIFQAIQQGATGYLLKDLPEQFFLNKLCGILNGEPPLSPSVARLILQHCAQRTNVQGKERVGVAAFPAAEKLTAKETEVLMLIAKGFSRKESAALLGVSENTIATHVRAIYRKLDISSRAEAALAATRMGLVSVDAA